MSLHVGLNYGDEGATSFLLSHFSESFMHGEVCTKIGYVSTAGAKKASLRDIVHLYLPNVILEMNRGTMSFPALH